MYVLFRVQYVLLVYLCVLVPLYLVTTVELRHCGSWKVTVSVVLLLTLRRTIDGASGGPEQGHREASACMSSASHCGYQLDHCRF